MLGSTVRPWREQAAIQRGHVFRGLSSSNLADTFWGLGLRSPNSRNWTDKRGMQWCSCPHFFMLLHIKILVLTNMTATAFLGHEALEFASERLKAGVLNVETAMRDWTALGFAVNCSSETRFRKGIWLMTCIRWFLLKLPLEIHDCRPIEVDIGMGTWWNLQMVRDGESGSAFFMSLLIWGGDWVSVQHTVQPLFPEWEHDGQGYQNRGAFFLGFHCLP